MDVQATHSTRARRRRLAAALRLVAGLAALVLPAWAGDFTASTAPLPPTLRDTGLYVDGSMSRVRPENLPFSPQYALWSDGAAKRRWIYLPPGTFIDAARPEAWEFPPGTRLWKEFAHARAVETRYIERLRDGSWRYAAYVWNEDGTDAVLAPEGGRTGLRAAGAPEGRYDIPAQADCRACHEGARVPVLGFGALQLSPDRDPGAVHGTAAGPADVDLRSLVARGLVRNLPASLTERPPRIAASSATARAALGYLHGNCGHCHSGTDSAPPVDLLLAQDIGDAAATDRVLRSMIGRASLYPAAGHATGARVVAPGSARASVIATRMRSRDPQVQMPPLGTRIPDDEGLSLVERWINSLEPTKETAP
ncbi:hypothetical protein BURK1_00294 [Burkholderiales bacterium]|nr:hypothetical protein BURK1_00294 [Burkholderiales bacterium]